MRISVRQRVQSDATSAGAPFAECSHATAAWSTAKSLLHPATAATRPRPPCAPIAGTTRTAYLQTLVGHPITDTLQTYLARPASNAFRPRYPDDVSGMSNANLRAHRRLRSPLQPTPPGTLDLPVIACTIET